MNYYITLAYMLRRLMRIKRNVKRHIKTKGIRLICRELKHQ